MNPAVPLSVRYHKFHAHIGHDLKEGGHGQRREDIVHHCLGVASLGAGRVLVDGLNCIGPAPERGLRLRLCVVNPIHHHYGGNARPTHGGEKVGHPVPVLWVLAAVAPVEGVEVVAHAVAVHHQAPADLLPLPAREGVVHEGGEPRDTHDVAALSDRSHQYGWGKGIVRLRLEGLHSPKDCLKVRGRNM